MHQLNLKVYFIPSVLWMASHKTSECLDETKSLRRTLLSA